MSDAGSSHAEGGPSRPYNVNTAAKHARRIEI